MSEWYVVVEGQTRGPVSTATVLTYLTTRNRAEVQVWREGFDDWRFASDVAELRAPPSPTPLVAIRDPEPAPEVTKPARKSRKLRWSVIGATIGFAYSLVGIAMGRSPATNIPYLVGYIFGGVGFAGLVGFLAGVIGDAFGRRSKPETIHIPIAPGVTGEPISAAGSRNFIARHWRGELPCHTGSSMFWAAYARRRCQS